MKRLLSVKELARELNVHVDTIRRAYRKGGTPYEKLCKLYLFDLGKVRCAMRANSRRRTGVMQPQPVGASRRRPR